MDISVLLVILGLVCVGLLVIGGGVALFLFLIRGKDKPPAAE